MSRLNTAISRPPVLTSGGAKAFPHLKPIQQLRRLVLACMLWEDGFYIDGKTVADQILESSDQVAPEELALLAIEARRDFNLRHVPLLLLCALVKREDCEPGIVANTIAAVIQRADELAELLAVYWRGGRTSIDHQLVKGLARAITKFDEYQLAKYSRDGAIKLRDVFRIARPKPENAEQSALWRRAVKGELATPDTWEVALSTGKDKKETFERLLREGNLGYLALLRNLRGMQTAGVDAELIRDAIITRKNGAHRVLPFRFISAARACPAFEPQLDIAMQAVLAQAPKIGGKTVIVADVSGSMTGRLSAKSELTRMDAGCALAAIGRELFSDVRIFATAGNDYTRVHATQEVPARRGIALVDAISQMCRPLGGGGIFLTQVMDWLRKEVGEADRVIVVTDEQDCDLARSPLSAVPIAKKAFMLNVGTDKNGIGYGQKWTNITGFSENVFSFIRELEQSDCLQGA